MGNGTGEVVYDDLVWAESPRWRDGVLWISDTQSSRLVEIDGPDVRVHSLGSPVNGTAFLANGEMVAASMSGGRIDRFDGERLELYSDLTDLGTGRLGDLTTLSDGTIYVDDLGDQGHDGKTKDRGRLLKIDPGGAASIVAEDLVFPNGLALVDGGETLVLAETFASRLTAFTVGPDGDLSDRRLWIDLAAVLGPEHVPDGLWPASDGSIWAATGTGEAFVRVLDGAVVERFDSDGFAIACCLDEDEKNLYATSAKSTDPALSVIEAVPDKKLQARVERHALGA